MNSLDKIRVKEYNLISKDVPPAFDGIKAVFLTDIHHSKTFSIDHVRNLVDRTNALEPDIILMGGDYVDRDPKCIPEFFREASKLKARLGVYGVLGNHDLATDAELSRQCMEEAGITLLDNHAVWLMLSGDRIRLGGVSDISTKEQKLEPLLEGTAEDDLLILVTHHPDYAMKLPSNKIDLMLSGHTHGGQISFFGKWVPPWPGKAKNKYLTGVVMEGDTTVIISNGIGTVGPPIRIFAAPQIWQINLVRPIRNMQNILH